jgi:hypothetical protein
MAASNVEAVQTLDRAIRRRLTESNGGVLPHDLAAAVVEAATEHLGDDDDRTMGDLNALFGLALPEPAGRVPLDDLQEAVGEIASILYRQDNLLDVLGTVATDWAVLGVSPQGTATMMSDGGIGLYEFTVDDRVYFFTLAEPDVCETEWWFAHAVGDLDARAHAIDGAQAAIGVAEYADDE